ncbi:hypothetical protein [Kordiimonas sp. UBA4487]|uniref:hypothetical protein n=1 Tax=Kordiimonas sp. UBA4487 TaxID=1946675 RepID=UPI00257FD8D8|nr:hypothetical protein [Kordiimonas sp. UBA4487]
MSWWLYQNWRAGRHKAVLHAGDCRFCNHGMGVSGGHANPLNGVWIGPFHKQKDAEDKQRTLPVQVRQKCSFCAKPETTS